VFKIEGLFLIKYDWKFVKNKFAIAGVAALAVVGLTAAPALAGTFGELTTINSTGGTSLTDGLKVDIASTQIQILRNGLGQLYSAESVPTPDSVGEMGNYFDVSFTDGDTDHSIGSIGEPWTAGTSSAVLSSDGKSGTVVNTVTGLYGQYEVSLEATFTYTFPDQFINVSTKLTLPEGWTFPTRLHWNTDSTLGGEDAGDQFEGTLATGQQVRGVVSPDGTQIEAFRQVSGQSLNSWAGHYDCPWSDEGTQCNPDSFNSWVENNEDAPNSISTDLNIDNGFGVSTPAVSAAGAHTASFDLLFVGCLDGVDALQCVNDAVTPAEPELANTGASIVAPLGAAVALMIAGVAVFAIRRKANA
jgi:hypothetical protein